jgi:hypothetical protein
MVFLLLGNLTGLELGGGMGGGFEGSTDLRGRLRNFMTLPVGGVGWARVAGREGGGRDEGGEGGGAFGGFLSGSDGGPGGSEGGGGGGIVGGCEDGGGGVVGGGGILGRGGRVLMGGGREAGTGAALVSGTDGGGREEGGVSTGMGEGERGCVLCNMDDSRVGIGGGVGDFFSTRGATTGEFSAPIPWGFTGGGLAFGAMAGLDPASANILAFASTPALWVGGDSPLACFSDSAESFVFGAGTGRTFLGEVGGG